jgi:hypothetical protein
MGPFLGQEMAKLRAEDLRVAAERERRSRASRRSRAWSARSGGRWRLVLGLRLVGAGFRLLGEQAPPLG